MDDRQSIAWLGFGLVAGLAAVPGLVAGGVPLLPLCLCGLCLACAAHRGSRALIVAMIGKLLAGSTLRLVLILFGAMLIWQLVGLELAFLLAGDVLAYVEVLAAVSLISANTRLARVRAQVTQRIQTMAAVLGPRRDRPAAARAVRRVRRKPSRKEDAEGGAAWAFA